MSAIDHADGHGVPREGSVEDHHLDDLPSQVQNDPVSESPDLLPSPSMPGTPTLPIAHLRASMNTAVASPSLAGLLRPPSSAARIG